MQDPHFRLCLLHAPGGTWRRRLKVAPDNAIFKIILVHLLHTCFAPGDIWWGWGGWAIDLFFFWTHLLHSWRAPVTWRMAAPDTFLRPCLSDPVGQRDRLRVRPAGVLPGLQDPLRPHPGDLPVGLHLCECVGGVGGGRRDKSPTNILVSLGPHQTA